MSKRFTRIATTIAVVVTSSAAFQAAAHAGNSWS